MEKDEVVAFFKQILQDDPTISAAVAAIQTLVEFMTRSSAETLSELRDNLKGVIELLTMTDIAVTSVSSGCELFLRFITLASLDHPDFQECKKVLIERGKLYLQKAAASRKKISRLCNNYIRDGATILTHSESRVVYQLLLEAAEQKKRFNVYITQSAPNMSGFDMHYKLQEAGILSTVILDSAVGYIMEKVDLVLVGAEGVVENGGIINKIGTFQIAVVAKAANKPFYAVAESFKFVRIYPLNQQDVPNKFRYSSDVNLDPKLHPDHHPSVDCTPPAYITLLFTDLGVLTPSAVSDELIKLYC